MSRLTFILGLVIGVYLGKLWVYTYWHRQWYYGFFEGALIVGVLLYLYFSFRNSK